MKSNYPQKPVCNEPGDIHKFRIRGKVVLSSNEKLLPHLDKIVEVIAGHLKRAGLRDVTLLNPNWILFRGRKINFLNLRKRDFKNLVDHGAVKVYLDGSTIVTEYYASTLKGWTIEMGVYSAVIVPTFLFSPILSDEFPQIIRALPYLLLFLAISLGVERVIKIHWNLRRELRRTVQTAENAILAIVGMHDTSSVEPEHRTYGPADLLRSAYFYRENGFLEKSQAYLSLLVEKYPWTHQADSAVKLLGTPKIST
jgi:hypothetical protein